MSSGPLTDKPPTSIAAVHDFGAKLRQPSLVERLKEYVLWQASLRGHPLKEALPFDKALGPERSPISINLDLTTACNYLCDHCVDYDILNTGIRHDDEALKNSLALMADKGLRSVILIGGGEPTVYPKFEEIVHFLKDRAVQTAVVTNGSGNAKILSVAHRFDERDWVRLSLDSGNDATFQAMHKPKKKITLDQICDRIPLIKEKNPRLRIGFSFIITWKGATANNFAIVENIGEIVEAAERARRYQFDYISFKPFLERAPENNAEVVGITDAAREFDETIRRIRREVDRAKSLETPGFRVVESTNLRVLENRTYKEFTRQPKTCHFQFFRQVLSPLGIYNCPVYRHVPQAKMGEKGGYATPADYAGTRARVAELIRGFNATSECKEVTCLYNPANWWLEDLIEHPEKLEMLDLVDEQQDFFF